MGIDFINRPFYNVAIKKYKFAQDSLSWVFFMFFFINFREAIYMMLEEYTLDNTKIKFYDDCIVANTTNQKEYIDNIIINLINNSPLL